MRTMKIVVLALLLVAVGCQSMQEATPETHVANARAIYIAAVQTGTTLAAAGVIDLKVAEQFEDVRVRAEGLLAKADEAVESGADFNFADLTATIASLQTVLTIATGAIQEGE